LTQGHSVMSKLVRSRKAQEVHAEQLLKLSTSLLTAFFVVIFIVPISSIVAASFNNSPEIDSIDFFLKLFGSWHSVVFIFAELGLYYIVVKTKESALSIYGELYPDGNVDT